MSILKVSPFAPKHMPVLPEVPGVQLAACEAGIKYAGRKDLMLARFAPGTAAAGVLTRSRTASAPVEWCRAILPTPHAQCLVVNAGNANAFTGMRGRDAVRATAEGAASAVGCRPEEVLISSTGVIGEPLETERFGALLADLAANLTGDGWDSAAQAIMTTDTYPKLATRTVECAGKSIVINGIAKGSGMIAPDMATMLAYVFTDLAVAPDVLQQLIARETARTFNAITVDGDTSTSDTMICFASGQASERGVPAMSAIDSKEHTGFCAALHEVMHELATMIVRDGEGISKAIQIDVRGAESVGAARKIAMSIANSPLFKTAMAGEDANWGRVVMAVGKAGEAADRDRLAIWFGGHQVAIDGERAPSYDEGALSAYMKSREISVAVDVGVGKAAATVWTCDLTHDYISINADYRS